MSNHKNNTRHRRTDPILKVVDHSLIRYIGHVESKPYSKPSVCRNLTDYECDWYNTFEPADKIPDRLISRISPDAMNAMNENEECNQCCHTECKEDGLIRQKYGGREDVKNCLCEKCYKGDCSGIVKRYKKFSDQKGDIVNILSNDATIGRDYIDIMGNSGDCVEDEKTCEEALLKLDEMRKKYDNPNVINLGKEIEIRRQYINSCVDDTKPDCKSSQTHVHWMNKLDKLLTRAQFMSKKIQDETRNVKTVLYDKRYPKSPKDSPVKYRSPKKHRPHKGMKLEYSIRPKKSRKKTVKSPKKKTKSPKKKLIKKRSF